MRAFFKKTINKSARLIEAARVPGYPIKAWIEPTTRCNLRCLTCGKVGVRDQDHDLDPVVFERIAEELLPNILEVELVGYGEPLVYPRFRELLDRAVDSDLRICMTTNGTLLTDDLITIFVRQGGRLTLSLDGATAGTFESIRPQVKFEKMLRVLERIRAISSDIGNPLFSLSINFVVMRRNLPELVALIELAHKYGTGEVCVFNFGVGDRADDLAREALKYHPGLAERYFPQAAQRAKELGVRLNLPYIPPASVNGGSIAGDSPEKMASGGGARRLVPLTGALSRPVFQKCSSPWRDVYITVDGGVRPCCMVMDDDLGNLKTHSFREVWNNTEFWSLRRRVHSFDPPVYCRLCNVPWGITGGNEEYYGG